MDGAPITVEVTAWLIPYELGPAIAVSFVDITEKNRAIHEAAERADAQRLALSVAQLGAWSRDVATGALTLSERAAEIYGLSPPYPATWEELRGMLEFPGSDEFSAVARKALAAGTDFDIEFQVRRADGEWRWVAVRGSWLLWPDGSPREVRGVMQDVSERKRYEQRIVQLKREIETRVRDFETLFAAMPAAVAVSRENTDDIRVNPTMSRLLGVPVTVNVSKTAPDAGDLPFRFLRRDGSEVPGDQLPQQVAFREARPVENVELEVLRADGARFHLFGSASPLFGEAGKVRGTVGAFVDVTERRAAEDALRASEERYRSLVQASVSIVWTADARGRAITPQAQFSNYTGLSWDEYKEYGWLDAVHPDDREGLRRMVKAMNSRVLPHEFECRVRHAPSGSWKYCLTRAVPVLEPGGAVREWVGTITDIDEQKRTQLALRYSEERFRRVIEGSIFGIVIKAFDGPIIYANSAFLKIIGYTNDDLEQGCLNWHTLTPPSGLHWRTNT